MSDDDDVNKVVELDLGVMPEAAVSGPFLMQGEGYAILTFNGTRERPDGMRNDAGTAVVEIKGCLITRFGYPNDEALSGHPLYGRGLRCYSIFEVQGSSWISQLEAQNRVAFPKTQRGFYSDHYRHFVFTFHGSRFECIAGEIHVTVSQERWPTLLHDLAERFKDY